MGWDILHHSVQRFHPPPPPRRTVVPYTYPHCPPIFEINICDMVVMMMRALFCEPELIRIGVGRRRREEETWGLYNLWQSFVGLPTFCSSDCVPQGLWGFGNKNAGFGPLIHPKRTERTPPFALFAAHLLSSKAEGGGGDDAFYAGSPHSTSTVDLPGGPALRGPGFC